MIDLKHLGLFVEGMRNVEAGGNWLIDIGEGRHRWVVVIPDYWPPSVNRWAGQAHWALTKLKNEAFGMLHAYGRSQSREGTLFPRLFGKVKVRCYRLWGKRQRELDEDNLNGSAKWFIDALRCPSEKQSRRRLAVIENDAPKDMELHIKQHAASGDRAYMILVVEGAASPVQMSLDTGPAVGTPMDAILDRVAAETGAIRQALIGPQPTTPRLRAARRRAYRYMLKAGHERLKVNAFLNGKTTAQ